jgi:hypothetical protein
MPFYLVEREVASEVEGLESALIVPCRFCPAASAAVRSNEPYINFPRNALTTASYDRLVKKVRSDLEDLGLRVDVFESRLVHQFVLCMWTSNRRKKLAELAQDYDALVVMGCEGAVDTVRDAIGPSECRVIQGERTEGLMSIQPRFSFPATVRLELQGVSPTTFPRQQA